MWGVMVKELGARWKRRANGDQQQWQSRAVRAEEKGMSMVVERIPEPELARHMVERHAYISRNQRAEGGRHPSSVLRAAGQVRFCTSSAYGSSVREGPDE